MQVINEELVMVSKELGNLSLSVGFSYDGIGLIDVDYLAHRGTILDRLKMQDQPVYPALMQEVYQKVDEYLQRIFS